MRVSKLTKRTLLVLSLSVLPACVQQATGANQGTPGAPADSGAEPPEAGATDATAPTDDGGPASEAGLGADGVRGSLVLQSLWKELETADDPFDDRPETSKCTRSGYMSELLAGEDAFSVETARCNYVTVTQPARRAVAAGDTLKVRLWHFELTAFEPAEAHVAVFVDDLPVLDERVPIPKAGGLLVREVVAERAIPAGAPVYFHLHNHGANSWSLLEVSAGP